jgi:hypothetical protein
MGEGEGPASIHMTSLSRYFSHESSTERLVPSRAGVGQVAFSSVYESGLSWKMDARKASASIDASVAILEILWGRLDFSLPRLKVPLAVLGEALSPAAPPW